jgi:predicted P-loop ATPase
MDTTLTDIDLIEWHAEMLTWERDFTRDRVQPATREATKFFVDFFSGRYFHPVNPRWGTLDAVDPARNDRDAVWEVIVAAVREQLYWLLVDADDETAPRILADAADFEAFLKTNPTPPSIDEE